MDGMLMAWNITERMFVSIAAFREKKQHERSDFD
jgi:hypothetical protein